MKVFVTGVTGFIGSHVAEALVKGGHSVLALVRPGSDLWRIKYCAKDIELIYGDVFNMCPRVSVECCIHLAWYVEPGCYLNAQANVSYVAASLRFADGMARNGCRRFVAAGTCFEYALGAKRLAESARTTGASLYATSKVKLQESLDALCQKTKMQFSWPRLFYQYGPKEDPRRLVPYIINALLREQPARVNRCDQTCDFLHVSDVASAVCALAVSRSTGPINIGSGIPITVGEVAGLIGKIMGRPGLLECASGPAPGEGPSCIVADNTRLKNETDWQQRYDLASGIADVVEWWKVFNGKGPVK